MSLNGLTDEQLIKTIQIKEKSNGKLTFSQMGNPSQVNLNGKPTTIYNNVNMGFSDEGFKSAGEVLTMLGT